MNAPSFLTRFEEQAARAPELTAVTFEDRELSYGQLDEHGNRLARYLRQLGIGRDSIVGVCVDRSLELPIAVLGVLKAGAAYLPLDAHYPSDRLAFMLEDSRASFLIRRSVSAELPAVRRPELELELQHPLFSTGNSAPLAHAHTPDSLAYAIYTSGSTGKPKGVAMVHRALDNLIEWQLADSCAAEGSATLQFAPLSFDVHFQEMFSTWCSGGRLVLVREELRLEMLPLLSLIERERVERLFLPFIALQSLADIALSHGRVPKTLREIITAGEQLQVTRAIRELFLQLPEARLYNHYGPSETHVVTSLRLADDPTTWPDLPSIGRALPNVDLAIIGDEGAVVAPASEGELLIGGIALARGYLHRPELTAERFVEREGAQFYRTGDLVTTLANGELQFLGRLDGQVKVNGYRVELGEIEVALSTHAAVREAAATVHERRPGDKRIVAYVVAHVATVASELRDALRQRLPEYMLPAAFVFLDTLPRTPSGKVDKQSLPAPSRARPQLAVEMAPPSTETERRLAEIWRELLDLDDVGTRDNFFDLGGNSLLALRAIAATARATQTEIPIVRFFEHPTIAEQAAYVANPSSFNVMGAHRVTKQRSSGSAAIAIIGMAGRFPGARSVDELWRNLQDGVESIERFSAADRDEAGDQREPVTYVPARGVLADADRFDAAFFGISPNEAAVLDPQQRLLLETSWNALENAGYAPNAPNGVVGVFAGTHNNTYFSQAVARRPDAVARLGQFATMVASEKDYVATRIANKLDLTGPALSIHTACSTSLVAIATAVQQLRAGFCDMALAGGASLTIPQRRGHLYEEGGMLSRDGHTRAFDADASGTVFSDGVAMLVLKPLDAAVADGDTVHAVIRGVGLNNDGGHKASFTAPSVQGQAAAIAMAHADANVSARQIAYVEAHGTATPLGDPIEVEALTQAFRRTTDDCGFCALGSIKSNFGHLTAAAGVAGVIKVALALQNEQLPPSLHFQRPNPKIAFDNSPFFVAASSRPWVRAAEPRLAGVSSFGVGGTNAHVVLGEGPPLPSRTLTEGPRLLVVSARTAAALDRSRAALADALAARPDAALADAAYTLALGRTAFAERCAIVASTMAEAVDRLRASDAAPGRARANAPPVVFLFPGQGSQYAEMGRTLYESESVFRLTLDHCSELLLGPLGRDLRELLYPSAGGRGADLRNTQLTQTALFAVEYALARTLMAWGIQPAALCGHSVGEFVAATLAGVFELEQALALVAARGRLMQAMPTGSMLSVRASAERIAALLPSSLDLAADNARGLCVVAGATPEIERFARTLEADAIASRLLETSHAFHSRAMDAAVASFTEEVQRATLSAPRLPIVSTATGGWLSDAEAVDPQYWATHLRRTVRFTTAVETLAADATRVLLEVGPRKTLTTLVLQRQPGDDRPRPDALPTLGDRIDGELERVTLLSSVGRLWTSGVNVDWRAFYRTEAVRRMPLPGYAFERERHWLDNPTISLGSSASGSDRATPPLTAPESPPITEVDAMNAAKPLAPSARRERLISELKTLFQDTSGLDFDTADPSAHFLELGVDSLLVTQLALRLKQTYRVPITFRQLMEGASSFTALASLLDTQLPAETAPATSSKAYAAPIPSVPASHLPAPADQATPAPGSLALTQQLLQLQIAQLTLVQQQLAALAPATAPAPAPLQPQGLPITTSQPPLATQGSVAATLVDAGTAGGNPRQVEYDVKNAFGAIARIHQHSDNLSPKQMSRLAQLTERYCAKTKSSKEHTQKHRGVHADPRVVNGFKPRIKELVYPIVTARSSGCRLWDLDGNEYVDALNGFGSNFFGYSATEIADALRAQIDKGFEIGPQTALAGECAELVCELTGMDRAAFCNTGSEAVMGALRIARTVTGRSLVVAFSGSYHGIFDEVIVRDTKTMRAIPAAPGILPEAVQNMLVLEYGTEQSLRVLRERGDDIAAVLVEPVQSRRPDFQPRSFLEQARQITRASGSALIFDEVITGFRAHPGGAQAHFGVAADLATYGKVVGGGMPIGVIAGRHPWMDALDGGPWQFGDESSPSAGVTYFAGTFVRHPLAMAATRAALQVLKREGPALQERLNATTSRMAAELNAFFKSVSAPLEIRSFASLWKAFYVEPQPYGELLFCYLRDRGLHIWDGFPCFLTMAHGESEVRFIVEAFKAAVTEMQAADFFPGGGTTAGRTLDANAPPVPGARLGRDARGNPAWFVPNPDAPGKYLQLT